jgi:hypothetical protein
VSALSDPADEAPQPPVPLQPVDAPAPTAVSFARVLRHRPGRPGPATTVEPHGLRVDAWRPSDDLVQRYRDVVETTARLPLTFPAIVVSTLHRDLMGLGGLPVSGLGLVHVATQLWADGCLPADQPWRVSAWADGARHVRSGLEMDLWGACTSGDASWTVRVVVLSRSSAASGGDASAAPSLPSTDPVTARTPLVAGEGAGRAYARVSGDYNPIHLHSLTARAFGFRRAIAHGWWTVPRALALLGVDETPAHGQRRLRVAYRRPVELPSQPTLCGHVGPNETRAVVERADGKLAFGLVLASA